MMHLASQLEMATGHTKNIHHRISKAKTILECASTHARLITNHNTPQLTRIGAQGFFSPVSWISEDLFISYLFTNIIMYVFGNEQFDRIYNNVIWGKILSQVFATLSVLFYSWNNFYYDPKHINQNTDYQMSNLSSNLNNFLSYFFPCL